MQKKSKLHVDLLQRRCLPWSDLRNSFQDNISHVTVDEVYQHVYILSRWLPCWQGSCDARLRTSSTSVPSPPKSAAWPTEDFESCPVNGGNNEHARVHWWDICCHGEGWQAGKCNERHNHARLVIRTMIFFLSKKSKTAPHASSESTSILPSSSRVFPISPPPPPISSFPRRLEISSRSWRINSEFSSCVWQKKKERKEKTVENDVSEGNAYDREVSQVWIWQLCN